MDFRLTPEQVALREEAALFARRFIADEQDVASRYAEERFSAALWQEFARFGVHGLPFPPDFGGRGADLLTTVALMEGFGEGGLDSGLLFGINAQMWSVQMPILTHGSDEMKRQFLPGLIGGSIIGGHCMSEPESGSDAFSLQTIAQRQGGSYIISGRKTFVTNGPDADIFLVFATVDRAAGFMGVTAFLVDRDTPGLSVSKIEKIGLRTVQMGQVDLDGCLVPDGRRLGAEGAGASLFNASLEWERAAILGCTAGAMTRQLHSCGDFLKQTYGYDAGGGPFAEKLVDMKLRLEAARLLIYRVAWLKQTRGRCPSEAAMTKLYVSEAWHESCNDALAILGGEATERDLLDSIGGLIYSGTSEIQRNIIARLAGMPGG